MNERDCMMDLILNIEDWGRARQIIQNSTTQAQMLKLTEEVGELAADIAKGRPVHDSIGDCVVVLTLIAAIAGTSLDECTRQAYTSIKDRKGYMSPSGVFIKEE